MFYELSNLLKAENPQQYKALADKGSMVGFPVSFNGETHRKDNGVSMHSTVKFFDPSRDHPHKIHEIAKQLQLNPPNPKTTGITPEQFKDRFGNDVHVLVLSGNDADKIKEHNSRFSHMGYPANFDYKPHISIEKARWDDIKASGAKTAHEAGIEFGPAELKQGPHTLATYKHPMIDHTPVEQHDPIMPVDSGKDHKKLAASENFEENLNKGALKNAMTGIAMGAALATHTPAASAPTNGPDAFYDHHRMLNAISQVESNGGKNTKHAEMGGKINGGQHSYGRYGLTPSLIQETIRMNPDLKSKHSKALALKGDQIHKYMHDNKGLEDQIADKHLSRLEHHFGKDPEKLGHSWLNGVAGTNKAIKNGEDFSKHWHSQKVKNAYIKEESKK